MISITRARTPFVVSLVATTAMAATLLNVRTAHASLTQQQDSFDTSPTDWWFEQAGTRAFGTVGPGTAARSPSQLGLLAYIFGGGSTSEWSALGKIFFLNGTEGGGDFPTITSCAAGVWLRTPSSGGAKGQLEIINPFNNTYIGIATFNLSASSGWTQVVAGNTWTCTPWLEIRVVLDNTTRSETLWIDDVVVQWGH